MGVSFTGSEAWLEDRNASPLYSFGGSTGSKIYLTGTNFSFNFTNFVGTRPKTMINHGVISSNSETTQGDEENSERRKGHVTYTGFENPIMTLSGVINKSEAVIGSRSSDMVILTPGILRTLAINADRTFYLNDNGIINLIINDPFSETPNPWTGSSAIPVVIRSIAMTNTSDSELINYDISFVEDKVVSV